LAQAGGHVEIVAREVIDDIAADARNGTVRWLAEEPRLDDAAGAFVVVNAIRDEAWSRALFAGAVAPGGYLLCCIDQPDYCTFTNVATVRRGPLQIGIATNGAAPMLAARMREALSSALDDEFTRFVEHLAALREESEPGERRERMTRALAQFAMDVKVTLPDA
jgi:siroheme synthase-like protein